MIWGRPPIAQVLPYLPHISSDDEYTYLFGKNIVKKGRVSLNLLEKARIRVVKVEERSRDSWVDMGLRTLREGNVRFYRVSDPVTGKWLFKTCTDEEMHTILVRENEFIKLKARVTDPDRDEVSYSFSKPLSANGEWKTTYGDAGEYMVTLTATDGKLRTEKKIKIVVERVNVAPIVEGITQGR